MTTWKFITNKQKVLSETIQNILPTSEKIDILVGYFYFSWFDKLYTSLQEKKMRVLVWMEIELTLKNKIKEVYIFEKSHISNSKEDFIEQLKQAFNKTDLFDNEETKESVHVFI